MKRSNEPEDERGLALLGLLVFLVLLLSTCGALAQGPEVTLPPVPDVQLPEVGETVALERGGRAPWAGMLVRDEDLFELQSQVMRLRLTIENGRRLYQEAIAGRSALLEQAQRAADERVELHTALWRSRAEELAAALEQARAREGAEWYEHPALWFAVGAVVAGALCVGIAAAVGGGS